MWKRVTEDRPCPVCGKPDWCRIDVTNGTIICNRKASDIACGDGGEGWYHPGSNLGEEAVITQCSYVAYRTIHTAYTSLQETSSPQCLINSHQEYLHNRGINNGYDLGYRSTPHLRSYPYDEGIVKGVAGFFCNEIMKYSVNLQHNSLFVPYKNLFGQIVGAQEKLFAVNYKRFCWLSSASLPKGVPAKVRIHWAFPKNIRNYSTIWLTEGAVKADSIAQNIGEIAAGVPGVGCVKALLCELKAHFPYGRHDVVVALDQDGQVATERAKTAFMQKQQVTTSGDVYLAEWPSEYKGIDDAIVGGARITKYLVV